MLKGGKRYYSKSIDGKWFAHPVLLENETRSRETCTSTGIMLTQVKASLPQAFNLERYPKWRTQQESREYPFSKHDNKHFLKENVSVFNYGVGRRKCPDDHRQHNSHFCLCRDAVDGCTAEAAGNNTVYHTDFMEKPAVDVPTISCRRFTHDHRQKSAGAALAQAGERYMWFGRHDARDLPESLDVLGATRYASSKH